MLDGVGATADAPEPEAGHLQLVQEVAGLWFAMQSRLQAHFAALAAEQSLSAIQAKVLIQLDQGGAVTTRSLADVLQYDPSNLTGVIDRLEALGAVRRRPDPRDRRVKGVVLTERGQELRDTFWRRLVGVAGPLGQLSEAELAQLRTILRSAMAEPPA
jgi:DNA-binding MarR family transcriptional regulator